MKIGTTSAFKMKFIANTADDGSKSYSTKTFSDVNAELADDDVLAVANGLAGLQTREVEEISRVDVATLVQA